MPGRLGAPGACIGVEPEARENQTPLQGEFLCPVLIVRREGINSGFTQADHNPPEASLIGCGGGRGTQSLLFLETQ